MPGTRFHNVRSSLYNTPNNGIADALAGVNAALAAVIVDGGGELSLPAGTYLLSAGLDLTGGSGLTIRGAGIGVTTIICAGIGTPVIQNAGAAITDVTIQDLTIDNTSELAAGGVGLDLTNISRSQVRNVLIQNVETGILLNTSDQNKFDQVEVDTVVTGIAVQTGCNNNTISDAVISNCTDGITVTGGAGGSSDLTIQESLVTEFSGTALALAAGAGGLTRVSAFNLLYQNAVAAGTGTDVGAAVANTTLYNVRTTGVTTPLTDAGTNTQTVVGGAAQVAGADGGVNGVGETVSFTGGDGGSASGNGGPAQLTGGAGVAGNAVGGAAPVTGGAGQGNAAGGVASVTGGVGGATGAGGNATVVAGAGGATSGAGGIGSVAGGAGTGAGANGGAAPVAGGAGVTHTVGTGGTGGTASVTGGAAGTATGNAGVGGAGGPAQVAGAAGGASTDAAGGNAGAGGAGYARGGAGGAASGTGAAAGGAGGAVDATAGAGGAAAGTSAAGAGGAASVVAGDGGAKTGVGNAAGGAGGAAAVTAGAGGATASNGANAGGAGGAVNIGSGVGGNASAGTGAGGIGGVITLTPGAGGTSAGGAAGARGHVKVAGAVALLGNAQTINMADAAVTLTRVPGTPAGTEMTSNLLYVDPNSLGGSEDLLLPPEADCNGLMLLIANTGGESIAVQNDAGGAVETVLTAEVGLFFCDGVTWRGANIA